MPLYEYHCPNGHDFEKFFRSIGAATQEEKCPECGALAERRISAAGLVFKGSGFYITDYGKDGKKREREATKLGKDAYDAAKGAVAETSAKPAESTAPAAPPSKPAESKSKPADSPASTSKKSE